VIITCNPNFETTKYLELKKRKALALGIEVEVCVVPEQATTEEVVSVVVAASVPGTGVVVQLPLPATIDREVVLRAIPVACDPDGFWYGQDPAACPSPVVVAIAEIARRYGVEWAGRQVVVMGAGRLVGQPAAYFARTQGAHVVVVTKDAEATPAVLASADILITGVGVPGLVTPAMVRPGVAIFDAGTSEDGGVLRGDVAPEVAAVASVFTPVPGGIGPITIAALLQNTVRLAAAAWQRPG
jgi:methylenetetrahydrofolate dehydrogenase (NADP+)/methenyltetrahydrofolate cyclohydrolase